MALHKRLPLVEFLAIPFLRILRQLFSPSLYFSKVAPNPIVSHGHKIFYRPGDVRGLIFPIFVYGEYEPKIGQWIQRLLSPGMTMVDVGAHIGYHTLLAARAVGFNGRVYAFEPVPSTVAILMRNIETNGYKSVVTVVSKAVADRAGRVKIFFDEEENTALATAIRPEKLKRILNNLEVEAISLDEFFSRLGWPPVNLVKIDVEGLETKVIDGMKVLSFRNPHLKLLLEVHSDTDPKRLFETLLQCGFSQFRIWADMWRGETLINIQEIGTEKSKAEFVNAVRYKNKMFCEKP